VGLGTVQADVFLVPQIGNARRFKVDFVSTQCPKRELDLGLESDLTEYALSIGCRFRSGSLLPTYHRNS